MSDAPVESNQQFQQGTPGTASVIFNNLTAPAQRLQEIAAAQSNLRDELSLDNGELGFNDLKATLAGIKSARVELEKIESSVQNKILPYYLARIQNDTMALSDPEAPGIGAAFVERMAEINCRTVIRADISCPAVYVSYAHGPGGGFLDQIGLNPSKISDDINDFASSLRHEQFHAFQKHAAPALHFSPFNPDTLTVVHPHDWILLEKLCEADAYAKQALFNSLEAVNDPAIREKSSVDVVTVAEFEKYRGKAWSLENALVNTALNALSKEKVAGVAGFTFADHYHGVAMDNFERGMKSRLANGERGHIFVRLGSTDFHQVGNYGVGPNALGQDYIDPQFITSPDLNGADRRRFDELCERYAVPPLDQCPTLSDILPPHRPCAPIAAPAP